MFCDICNTEQQDGITVEAAKAGTALPGYLLVCWGCLTYEVLRDIAAGTVREPLAIAS